MNQVDQPKRPLAGAICVGTSWAWLVLVTGCDSADSEPGEKAGQPPRAVEMVVVERKPIDRSITVLGSLLAYQEAVLSSKVQGRLESWCVDIGSVVKTGDTLAQVEARDYELKVQQAQAAVAQARARLGLPLVDDEADIDLDQIGLVLEAKALLEEAEANRQRVQKLTQAQIASSAEFESADAAHKVAVTRYQSAQDEARQRRATLTQRRAELEIAQQELNDTVIKTPFDGTTQARHASPGQFLQPGNPVLTLVQMNPLRLRMEVPEVHAARIQLGQEVRFTLTGDTHVHRATLSRVSPALEKTSRVLAVEADVPNPGTLHPGSLAETRIVVEPGVMAIAIPQTALRTFAGLEKVLVEEDGLVVEKGVTTGLRDGTWIEVIRGLKEGERLILNPGNLQVGEPVKATSS